MSNRRIENFLVIKGLTRIKDLPWRIIFYAEFLIKALELYIDDFNNTEYR